MKSAQLELYRHKTWATLRLIEHCQDLDDSELDVTTPGTYGTIRDTLKHLVEAEEGYFRMLTGERPSERLPEGPVPLTDLAERIRNLGPRWEVLAQDADAANRVVKSRDGWRMPGTVPMNQAIHHADDHRSHVLSILGARALEIPDLDIWAYAESSGLMQLDPTKKFSVIVHTTRGDFEFDLADPNLQAVCDFVYVAQNNVYDGLEFQRTVDGVFVGAGNGSQLVIASDEVSVGKAGEVRSRLGKVTSGIEVVDKIEVGDTVSIEVTAT